MSLEAMIILFVQLLIIAALFLLRHSLPSYLAKKGEGLATKQDIAVITEEVEKTRQIYNKQLEEIQQQNRLILEDFKNRNQLRLAALDKRLEVHQQAYTLWQKIVRNAKKEGECTVTVLECQDWWEKNCLYLTAEARDAFRQSFMAAWNHLDLLKVRPAIEEIKENWNIIVKASEAIVKGVSLPPIESEGASLKERLEVSKS